MEAGSSTPLALELLFGRAKGSGNGSKEAAVCRTHHSSNTYSIRRITLACLNSCRYLISRRFVKWIPACCSSRCEPMRTFLMAHRVPVDFCSWRSAGHRRSAQAKHVKRAERAKRRPQTGESGAEDHDRGSVSWAADNSSWRERDLEKALGERSA